MSTNENRSEQNASRVSGFKTRKSDLLSSGALLAVLGLWTTFNSINKDINELIQEKNRATEQRIERVERAVKDIIAIERDNTREDIQELKQRIIWIERALNEKR